MKKTILITMIAICSMQMQAQFSGKGSGTAKDPYQVTNADELFEVRNDLSAYYKQMNDIDLTEWMEEESPQQGWTPIGNESTTFKGSFDGDNYSIRGLVIKRNSANYIGLFGHTRGATIKNVNLVAPQIYGGNYVGSIVGYCEYYNNISYCNIHGAQIKGASYIGGICGYAKTQDGWSSITNNSVTGGTLVGSDNVGGVIGFIGTSTTDGLYNAFKSDLSFNFSSSIIKAKGISGGIAGVILDYYWNSKTYSTISTTNNLSESELFIDSSNCGGIQGGSFNSAASSQHNIVWGKINNTKAIQGIGTLCGSGNYCLSDTLYSTSGHTNRIGSGASSNNYAYNGMAVFQNGKLVTVEDNDAQGTGLGLRTLKKESTYVGAGFDFTNTWAIKEGETFPYLKAQVAPVTITSFEAGNKATIKGTATEGTSVYIIIGDNMYESYILDGQWEVQLGRIDVGTEAKVYAMARGRMPSISTKAKAEAGSSPAPQGTAGDANGDGVVDTADVTAIINYILGKPSASFNKENADVNGDGEILIDDAVQTVQMIMDAQ